MSPINDVHEVLQLLRFELNYLEQGGFERDKALLGTDSPFLGTFACINYGDPLRRHACRECGLLQFVPEDKQTEEFPCHFIPLNASGETIHSLIEKMTSAAWSLPSNFGSGAPSRGWKPCRSEPIGRTIAFLLTRARALPAPAPAETTGG